MRLAAYRLPTDEPDVRRVAVVEGDPAQLIPLPEGTDLVNVLAMPADERQALLGFAAPGSLDPADVVLLPPVYPVAMRDFLTFEAHVEGMEKGMHGGPVPPQWYEQPVFLFMAPHAVHGPYDEVAYPPDTERLDFELEIAAIICRDARNVYPDQAGPVIGGYCVMNDWSARDVQGKEMKLSLGPSKGKDFATTIGPWVVTPDELEQHRSSDGRLDLAMSVSVNGVQIGSDRSVGMGWSFEELVSVCSRASWIKAGEVIASGTCSTGSLGEFWGRTGTLEPPPLQIGDVVEMTIEGLGTIRNEIVASDEDIPPMPQARRRKAATA